MVDPVLLHYTERLLGLDAERCNAAVDAVRSLGLPHVSREFCERPDIDAVAASVLLIDGLRELEARGIERTKLLAKLRRDRNVWPTWAELTAASHLATFVADGAEFTLERGRGSGRHPDFWAKANADGEIFPFLSPSTASEVSIEFKALGLSAGEAAFLCPGEADAAGDETGKRLHDTARPRRSNPHWGVDNPGAPPRGPS